MTFERIRDQGGHFVVPFLLIVALGIVTALLNLPLLDYQAEQLGSSGQAIDPSINAEMIKTITRITAVVTPAFVYSAIIFISGLLLMLVNLVVRGEAKYMQLVKVALFSCIPGLLSGLLAAVLVQTMGPAAAADLHFSLAAFMEDRTGFAYGLVSLVNPFVIWSLAITVIGTAVMARKPTKQVAVWLLGGWFVLQLITIWLGVLVSGLAGM